MWLLVLGSSVTSGAQPLEAQELGDFDYFVFALSWSPAYCELRSWRGSAQECAPGAMPGFVVHGLWPTRFGGDDPADCGAAKLSQADVDLAARVFPSDWLARHEFQKHGTCSGMPASAYFNAVERLREGINIPDVLKSPASTLEFSAGAIKKAFLSANPTLHLDNMSVICARKELVEVRFCLSRDLSAFAPCPANAARDCRATRLTVAPAH